jgi:hypothetical protein
MNKTQFERDKEKDNQNHKKHDASFALAQHACLDPHRIIAEDTEHGTEEDRYYCFGRKKRSSRNVAGALSG